MNSSPRNNRKRGQDFTKNYTIPKKQFKGDWKHQTDADYQYSEPVSNSYDDYQEPALQRFQSRGPNTHGRFPPASDFDNSPNIQQANFQNAPFHQQRFREVPKTAESTTMRYQDTYGHNFDPTLPKELTEQFQPLYCKLCSAQLSSNVMAKLHYKSKNHEKKIRKFLVEYSERTGEPLHERVQVPGKHQAPEDANNPKFFHCDVCDLALTGRLHAESHYMGRNHHRALAGKAPAGKGHYDTAGTWKRMTNTPAVPSDRDNFGLDFVKPEDLPAVVVPAVPDDKPKHVLSCELCGVSATSEQQMTMHMNGQKHKKKMQQKAREQDGEITSEAKTGESILSSLASVNTSDLSVYRTPTGDYYCKPCNMSVNSETQFKQHLGSKKHRKKASPLREPTA